MPVQFLGLVPALFFALSNVLTRRGMDGSNPHTGSLVVVEVHFLLFAASLLAVDFTGVKFSWYWAAFLAAGVVSPALSLSLSFRSIAKIGVAPTSSLSNVHAFFGAFWAFLILGERPSSMLWLGILIVVTGVYILSGGRIGRVRPRDMVLPLSASACFGLAHTLRKLGFTGHEPLLFEAFLQAFSAAVAVPFMLRLGVGRKPFLFNRRSLAYFILAGAAMALAQMTLLYALRRGRVSVVSPIVSTAPLFTLLLTPILLRGRERITLRLAAGIVLVAAGVVLVTSTRQ